MAEAHGDEETEEGLVEATLAYVAKSLVAHPEDVRVISEEDDRGLLVRLEFNPEDAGRLIGRGGRIARAMRAVVKAAAAREDILVHVQIGDRGVRGAQGASEASVSPPEEDA